MTDNRLPRSSSTQRIPRRRHGWIFKTLLSLVAVVGSLAVCELALERIAPARLHRSKLSRSIRLKEHRPDSDEINVPSGTYLSDTEGLERGEYRLRTDSDGFIEPSQIHQHADLQIFFLGGSSTECQFVPESKRFPYLVGRSLEEATALRVNSFNGGVSGNHSMHCNLILLGKVVPRRPDMVVLMECINDLVTLTYTGTYWNRSEQRSIIVETSPLESAALGKSSPMSGANALLKLTFPELYSRCRAVRDRFRSSETGGASDEWASLRNRKLQYDLKQILGEYRHSLETFCRMCRTHGIEPVLMTQPNRCVAEPTPVVRRAFEKSVAGMDYPYNRFRGELEQFNEAIRSVAVEERVFLIDLERAVPKEASHMYDVVHYNSAGSEFVAKFVAEKLHGHLPDPAKRTSDGSRSPSGT
jgi:lysophospholipase L1-like esterase